MSRSTDPPRSPTLARALCRWLLLTPEREFILGDIEEEFHDLIARERDAFKARRWYWSNVLSSIRAARRARRRSRLSLSLPFFGRIMDNLLVQVGRIGGDGAVNSPPHVGCV